MVKNMIVKAVLYLLLMCISDGTRTTTYNYSGDKLIAVHDPLRRVTIYEYLAGNSFLYELGRNYFWFAALVSFCIVIWSYRQNYLVNKSSP